MEIKNKLKENGKKINLKKIIIIVVSVIIAIIFLSLIWAYINSDKEVTSEMPNEIIPAEEINDEQLRISTVVLYFVDKDSGEIVKETKKIDVKKICENPYTEIINLWLKGPENNKLTNSCLENTKINEIKVQNGCAIVDFSGGFIEDENSSSILNKIYCIVNTLTELTEIDSVKILIDGKENVSVESINLSEQYVRLKE